LGVTWKAAIGLLGGKDMGPVDRIGKDGFWTLRDEPYG